MAPGVFSFRITARDSRSKARAGTITTSHGAIDTPAFLPVGTAAAVKGVAPGEIRELGVQAILANTYHLHLRPGEDVIARLGGIHRFMGWEGPIVTDSGGFQVFSLAGKRTIDDDGVTFASHIDGATVRLTPEKALEIQRRLGSDIVMPLDHCPSLPSSSPDLREAVERTLRWAERSLEAHRREGGSAQALFGIVQGGADPELRPECATRLVEMGFPGYAIGGVAVGEEKPLYAEALDLTLPHLPEETPRYLMGVGTPEDIVMAVDRGVDFFDCVAPTRNARNALAYTAEGKLKLRNAKYAEDSRPLDPGCDCPACRGFSRAYLRHLFMADEMLGPILATVHNLRFFARLMEGIRRNITVPEPPAPRVS